MRFALFGFAVRGSGSRKLRQVSLSKLLKPDAERCSVSGSWMGGCGNKGIGYVRLGGRTSHSYTGTSLIRNLAHLELYIRNMPRTLRLHYGGGDLFLSEVPLYGHEECGGWD